MALINCTECSGKVSDTAATCPHCGANVVKPKPTKRPMGLFTKLFLGVMGLTVIGMAFTPPSGGPTPAVTATAKTSPAKPTASEAAATLRLQMAGAGAMTLKNAMKDPQAFELTSLVVHPSGAACYDYRAKNSFGAILPSSAVLTVKGKLLTKERDGNAFVAEWNRDCTKVDGQDITETVKRLGIV